MKQISHIGLSIYGGAQGENLDAVPLVTAGEIPDNFQVFSPMLVKESSSWIIYHALSYTLYALYSEVVCTSDSKPGQLLICLFIPVQKKLADGKGGLGLLDSVWNVFALYGMRSGKLSEVPIDNAPFVKLLEQYRLEDRQTLLPAMVGSVPASFRVENLNQVDALMRYSRYDILSNVSRLELGLHCQTTLSLPIKGEGSRQTDVSAKILEDTKKESSHILSPLEEENNGNVLPKKKSLILLKSIAAAGVGLVAVYFLTDMLYDNSKKETENEILEASALLEKPAEVETTLIDTVIVEPKQSIAKLPMDSTGSPKEGVAVAKAKKKEIPSRPSVPSVPSWQSEVNKEAESCPISLRLGVHVTAITCNSNTVTCTLVYEEMSKYNITEHNLEQMRSDEEKIKKDHLSGLPSNVRVNFIKKDRAGRII